MTDVCLLWKRADGDVTFPLTPPGPLSVGRLPTCQVVLNDPKVSRSHARLQFVAGSWMVQDAGSQAGTVVNGRRLGREESVGLVDGDQIEFGPVKLEVSVAGQQGATLMAGAEASNEAFEPLAAARSQDFGHEHLALLLDLSEKIHVDASEHAMRRRLVEAIEQATRFANVAFVRRSNSIDGVEVIESIGEIADRSGQPRMSRTMLRNARDGMVLVTDKGGSGDQAIVASLERASVNQAFCIPVGKSGCHGFLYADNGSSRGDSGERQRLKEAARVANALVERAASEFDRIEHQRQSERLWRETLHAMVDTVEKRDPCTGGHSRRVAEFARLVGRAAGLDESTCSLIYESGRVHDIGKVAIDDAVLRKEGKLTDEEFAKIKEHPQKGHEILSKISAMHDLLPGVIEHHEKWDGSGYPRKLKGDAISRMARVMAVADVFDAITCRRPYRTGFPFDVARGKIAEGAGTHFDPEMVKAFLSIPEADLRHYMEQGGSEPSSNG
jgi:HD-GYP domain-containing protein (c-di-GMP phosphodiesterase class II)